MTQAWIVRYRDINGVERLQPAPTMEAAEAFAQRVRDAGETVIDTTIADWESQLQKFTARARGAVGRRPG